MAILALLIIVPILELYVFIKVVEAIGFLQALGILVAASLVGLWLVKRAGLRVWERFNEQIVAGTTPSREVADGVCLLLAGLLVAIPGFVTDALGLLLLLPPVRALARRFLLRRYAGRTKPVRVIRASYQSPSPGAVIDASGVETVPRPPPAPPAPSSAPGELERP